MECRCPVAGRWLDDTKLQHVFKFLAGNAQALRREAARSSRNWWASGCDVVCDSVFGGLVGGLGLGERREFGEEGLKLASSDAWEDRRSG